MKALHRKRKNRAPLSMFAFNGQYKRGRPTSQHTFKYFPKNICAGNKLHVCIHWETFKPHCAQCGDQCLGGNSSRRKTLDTTELGSGLWGQTGGCLYNIWKALLMWRINSQTDWVWGAHCAHCTVFAPVCSRRKTLDATELGWGVGTMRTNRGCLCNICNAVVMWRINPLTDWVGGPRTRSNLIAICLKLPDCPIASRSNFGVF